MFLVPFSCLVCCEMQLPVRATPIFEKGFGTQLMLGGSTRQQMLLYIEEKAKKILVVDEYNAVIRHIKQVCCPRYICWLYSYCFKNDHP